MGQKAEKEEKKRVKEEKEKSRLFANCWLDGSTWGQR